MRDTGKSKKQISRYCWAAACSANKLEVQGCAAHSADMQRLCKKSEPIAMHTPTPTQLPINTPVMFLRLPAAK